MKILVTGASGFVGKVFCEQARLHGHQIRRVVRESASVPDEECFVGDLARTQDWSAAFEGVDVVVHLAARVHQMHEDRKHSVPAYQQVNVDATRSLVQQAAKAGVKRFVFVSSIKVNGEETRGEAFTETSAVGPEDVYARSKWLAETELREHAAARGMEWVIIRPPLVYGAGVGGNFRRLLRLVDARWPLPLRWVSARRSYVSVWNLADLLHLCCCHPGAANQLFLAEDATLSVCDLTDRIGRYMGRRVSFLPIPSWVLKCGACLPVVGPALRRLTGELEVSAVKARTMLGWHPVVDLDEGLRLTVSHYLAHPEG